INENLFKCGSGTTFKDDDKDYLDAGSDYKYATGANEDLIICVKGTSCEAYVDIGSSPNGTNYSNIIAYTNSGVCVETDPEFSTDDMNNVDNEINDDPPQTNDLIICTKKGTSVECILELCKHADRSKNYYWCRWSRM
ncbi:hypothetical protein PIROE2DRAFT_7208, partial [Piromyces sp. E2]